LIKSSTEKPLSDLCCVDFSPQKTGWENQSFSTSLSWKTFYVCLPNWNSEKKKVQRRGQKKKTFEKASLEKAK
jgi:hypothetical protein